MSMAACAVVMAVVTTFKGVTFIDKPIVLTPADSGRTFVGEPGAVISGGVRLGPWTEGEDGVWSAPAPREADGRVMFFDQLWIDGRRAPNARLPNAGYFVPASGTNIVGVAASGATRCDESVTFTNAETLVLRDLPAEDLPYVQMGVIKYWSFARRALDGFDAATMTARSHSEVGDVPWYFAWDHESLVAFQNVRTAFDAPGEWFLDMRAGKVLYRPLPGEDVAALRMIAPRAGFSKLVEFRGEPEKGRYVENVTFRDVTFAHASFEARGDANAPQPVNQLQAACDSDGAITARGARNCTFARCRVIHTSNYAFRFDDGCVSNRIVDCTLEDLGAGGVWMGERTIGDKGIARPVKRQVMHPDVPTAVAFNLISNCTIRAAGRYNPEGTGVALTHCSDTKVVHCDIHDIYYTGVSVGYTWGFGGSVAQRNEIAFNRIYDLGKHVMSDMGGVYTLATSFGTTVHDNVIHDIDSFAYGGWALYCDEGSEGIELTNNLCWNTPDGGFHQHFGVGCIVRNNIFAWNRDKGVVRGREVERKGVPCSLHFVNNIVLVREGPLVGEGVRGVAGVWANNLWYDVRGEAAALFDKLTWAQWRDCGKETCGRFADPKFADAEHFDFTLKADSPAFGLGFKAWDYGKAGRR